MNPVWLQSHHSPTETRIEWLGRRVHDRACRSSGTIIYANALGFVQLQRIQQVVHPPHKFLVLGGTRGGRDQYRYRYSINADADADVDVDADADADADVDVDADADADVDADVDADANVRCRCKC